MAPSACPRRSAEEVRSTGSAGSPRRRAVPRPFIRLLAYGGATLTPLGAVAPLTCHRRGRLTTNLGGGASALHPDRGGAPPREEPGEAGSGGGRRWKSGGATFCGGRGGRRRSRRK